MLNKWNYLNECADGAHVISKIKSCYDDYEQELDRIEFEIQAYNNTSDEEWNMIVKEGKVPTSVLWYAGLLSTEDYLEYLDE